MSTRTRSPRAPRVSARALPASDAPGTSPPPVPTALAMSWTYDAGADVVAAWFAPDDGTGRTVEIAPDVHADVDAAGRLLSVEVLDASRYYPRAALEALAAPAAYLTLAEAAVESGLTPATLRVQASRGRIPAVKRGRDWLIERAALWTYLESRDPRGRRPAGDTGGAPVVSAERQTGRPGPRRASRGAPR